MSKRSKKRVVNGRDPHNKVSSEKPPIKNQSLVFDFSYQQWLQSISVKKFTNMLKDDEQFSKAIVHIFSKIIPAVKENWKNIKNRGRDQFRHCHPIANEKKELVDEIILEIYGKPLLDEKFEEMNYWQLGVSQGIRLIAIYNHLENIMYPVFIDHHHQIHPDVKHNQKDIYSYQHCAFSKYS